MKLPTFALAAVLCLSLSASAQITQPPPRFRLYKTENMWTQILLDTRTGKAWQVSFTVDKDSENARLPINEAPLVTNAERGRDGRFTLESSGNVYNFFLLDQDEGFVWRLQFSMDSASRRFIELIYPPRR